MTRPEHPIFGRASDSDEADDRAWMLESQLIRFCDQIYSEIDRLDDFLPAEKFVGKPEADDWYNDLSDALAPVSLAARTLIATIKKARANRAKVKA